MAESFNILEVCVRVLSACTQKVEPDPKDIQKLQDYVPAAPSKDANQLASAAIIKAVIERELALGTTESPIDIDDNGPVM